ncbi:MAG: hypothetical protein NTW74_20165, partial [Acidobacteria bacterium]|nr:hypothetical protein [Acidobacteriota bacterium]
GQRLLMQRKDQLLLWDRQTGWKSLAYLEEGFSESLLSDNGSIVFAITQRNQYLRIDANTSESAQLFVPMPSYISQRSFGAYPGSVVRFSTNNPDPKLILKIGETPLVNVKIEDEVLDAQIPWEATNLTPILEASLPNSPFVLRTSIGLLDQPAPVPFIDYERDNFGPYLVAANTDFSTRITPANPAPAGSLIHFWLSGLGPLDRPVATGEKGPSDPPARPLLSMECFLGPVDGLGPQMKLSLPTIVYAPNLIGVYQVDTEIPSNWPSGRFTIACRNQNFRGGTGNIFIRAR